MEDFLTWLSVAIFVVGVVVVLVEGGAGADRALMRQEMVKFRGLLDGFRKEMLEMEDRIKRR